MEVLDTSIHESWQSATSIRHQLNKVQRQWLLDQGSLTEKLINRSNGRFNVNVLNQHVLSARRSEYRALSLNCHHWALVREVILYGNQMPWVYARTVIPLSTLRGPSRQLQFLGQKPLGKLLFTDPKLRRKSVEIAKVSPHLLPTLVHQPSPAWGRRSVFIFKGKPLLVCEIFLENPIRDE